MQLYQHAKVTPSCPAVASPWCRGLLLHFPSARRLKCVAEGTRDCGVLLQSCRGVDQAHPQVPQLPHLALRTSPQQKAQRSGLRPDVHTWPFLASQLVQPQFQPLSQQWECGRVHRCLVMILPSGSLCFNFTRSRLIWSTHPTVAIQRNFRNEMFLASGGLLHKSMPVRQISCHSQPHSDHYYLCTSVL